MAVGLSALNFANVVLNYMMRATAGTPPASNNVQLHTGDPGAVGTTAVASVATRVVATFGTAASAGAIAMTSQPSWANWAGTSPTVLTHISVWDLITAGAGNFLYSAALAASKTVTTGDTFTLSSLSISLGTLAA